MRTAAQLRAQLDRRPSASPWRERGRTTVAGGSGGRSRRSRRSPARGREHGGRGAVAGATGAPGAPGDPGAPGAPGAGLQSTAFAGSTWPTGGTGWTRAIMREDAQRPQDTSRYIRYIVLNVVIVVISPLLLPRLHDEERRHLMNADEVGAPLHQFHRMPRVATSELQPIDRGGFADRVRLILTGDETRNQYV